MTAFSRPRFIREVDYRTAVNRVIRTWKDMFRYRRRNGQYVIVGVRTGLRIQ